jgi:hypothetical protein
MSVLNHLTFTTHKRNTNNINIYSSVDIYLLEKKRIIDAICKKNEYIFSVI